MGGCFSFSFQHDDLVTCVPFVCHYQKLIFLLFVVLMILQWLFCFVVGSFNSLICSTNIVGIPIMKQTLQWSLGICLGKQS